MSDNQENGGGPVEAFLGLIIFAVAIVVAWASRPISIYAIALIITAYLCYRIAQKFQPQFARSRIIDFDHSKMLTYKKGSFLGGLISSLFYSLHRAQLWIIVGVILVCLLQAAYTLLSRYIERETILYIEDTMILAHETVRSFLTFKNLLIALVVMLVITMLVPRAQMVSKFLGLKRALSACVIILMTATSFTFFATHHLQRFYDDKLRKLRPTARFTLNQIREHKRVLVAAAWVEKQVSDLKPKRKKEYEDFFNLVGRSHITKIVIRDAVGGIMRNMQTLHPLSEDARKALRTQPQNIIKTNIESYLDYKRPRVEPSYFELKNANKTLKAHEIRLREARKAAIEIVSEGLGEILPKADNRALRIFLDELTTNLSKSVLQNLNSLTPNNFTSAKNWINQNIYSKAPTEIGPIHTHMNLASNKFPTDDFSLFPQSTTQFGWNKYGGGLGYNKSWEERYMDRKYPTNRYNFPKHGFSGGSRAASKGASQAGKILRFLK